MTWQITKFIMLNSFISPSPRDSNLKKKKKPTKQFNSVFFFFFCYPKFEMQREERIVTQTKSLFQCLTMAAVTKSFRCKHTFFRNSENPTGICKYFMDVNHQQKVTYTQLVAI